jgi:purine-binding chemotaxis protein CheW
MVFDGEELLSRAERVSGEAATEEAPGVASISFFLAGELHGVPLADVREIAKPQAITPVPGLDPAILGAMSLRGEILAVADPRPALGLPGGTVLPSSRLLIVRHMGERVGLLVDAIGDLLEVTVPPRPAASEAIVLPIVLADGGLLLFVDAARLVSKIAEAA